MSEQQTGSEQDIVKPVEPKEVVVDGTGKPVEPTTSPAEAVISDEEILNNLQPKSETSVTESRKTKAIRRSAETYNKVLDESGYVNFEKLLVEFEKNPKGLETFAEANEFDFEVLSQELNKERGIQESAVMQRMNEIEGKLDAKETAKADANTKGLIKNLVVEANMTLSDFYKNSGEDFNLFVSGFQAQGKSAEESVKLAFERIQPTMKANSEKTVLLSNVTKMPLGRTTQHTVEIGLEKAEVVNSWEAEKRQAYKAKFRNSENVVKYL